MSLIEIRVAALCASALLLGGCPQPKGYIASTTDPVAQQEPAVEAPSQAGSQVEEPVASDPADWPTLSEIPIVRKNVAEGPSVITVETAEIPDRPTKITNQAAAERLFDNSGVTLQWISWERRGPVFVAIDENGIWWLSAQQKGADEGGIRMEGHISEIGADYFLFSGDIKIIGTPDADRFCGANRQWRFAVTQNRKYWRLREFEWCDQLTDYIDIYF